MPNKDRVSYGVFDKDQYYVEEPLPNPVDFKRYYPIHFNPITDHYTEPATFYKNRNTADRGVLKVVGAPKLKVCEVYLKKFKRCEMINGKGKCDDEG